jgi:outer membrane protein, multidrug efflux system
MRMRARFTAAVTGAVIAASLSACGLFPKKEAPRTLDASAPLEGIEFAGGGQWPAADWWKRYNDPVLDQLIALGLAHAPTLVTAHARFDSAQQSVRLAAAAAGAHVDANADINRQRLSDNGLFPPHLLGFTWYNQADLGLNFRYVFDWWGKQRLAVGAAVDQARAAQAERSEAALMLTSSITDTYFAWQADQNRLKLAIEAVAVIVQAREVARAQVRAELAADDLVYSADLALAAQGEQVEMIKGSANLRLVALAALVGKSVADLPAMEMHDLPEQVIQLPDDVKIDLISRRADIVASRLRIESAEKNLSSARAEFFPDVSINALLGLQSVDVGKLLEYSSRVPEIGAAIHLPIFDAGRLKAQYGGARANIDSAVASYNDTVISAAREVAFQVTTLAQISAARKERLLQLDAAVRIKDVAIARDEAGITELRPVLDAVQTWLQQRDALLQINASAVAADIALQRALGGGYEIPQKLANAQTKP